MRNVGCLFLLSLVCLFACKDETRENPPLKGDAFWLANPWKFYFVDAEGKSVLRENVRESGRTDRRYENRPASV